MGNWCGISRTNYFHPIERSAVEQLFAGKGIEIYEADDKLVSKSPHLKGAIALGAPEDWPASVWDAAGETELDFNFSDSLMPLIQEGEVVVVMTAGWEKMCYASGNASAFVRRGAEILRSTIDLFDIYEQAAKAFDISPDKVSLAEY